MLAPTSAVPPRGVLAGLAVGALAAGALAAWQPAAGFGLALLALVVTLLRPVPVPRIGRALVLVTAVAAIAGPNLALGAAPEIFAFRILIVLLGVGLLLYLLMDGRLTVPRALVLPAGIVATWFVWSALSIGWADDTGAAVRWTLFLGMMGGLAIALGLTARTPRRAVTLLVVLGATFVGALAVAFAEIVLGIRLPTSALLGQRRDIAFAATSLFGNQNNFATYLSLTLPYLVVLPVVFRDVRLKALGLAGTGAALVGLLFTGSKSNLLAVGLVLLGLFVLIGADRRTRGRLLAAAVVAGLAVLLVVPALQGGGVVKLPERAVTKFDFGLLNAQREAQTGSGAVRSSLLEDGVALVGETKGLGVGAGNAEAHVRSLANFPGVANLHNWWLEVLVNGGVVGFGLYLALYLTLLRRQLRAARTTESQLVRYLGLAGALALIGYVAGSLGPSTAIHFAPMWITFGLGMVTLVLAARARRGAGDEEGA